MGFCRNSSCVDSRRAQEIDLSDLKAWLNGDSHLERAAVFRSGRPFGIKHRPLTPFLDVGNELNETSVESE
jgi:hypothetical protein